jgi:hypothetical protein
MRIQPNAAWQSQNKHTSYCNILNNALYVKYALWMTWLCFSWVMPISCLHLVFSIPMALVCITIMLTVTWHLRVRISKLRSKYPSWDIISANFAGIRRPPPPPPPNFGITVISRNKYTAVRSSLKQDTNTDWILFYSSPFALTYLIVTLLLLDRLPSSLGNCYIMLLVLSSLYLSPLFNKLWYLS